MKIEDTLTFDDFFNMIKNNTKYKDENKGKYKRAESRYAFKGPVIEEKEDEEEGGNSPRKHYREDEQNGGLFNLNNGSAKLNTVADTIKSNGDK